MKIVTLAAAGLIAATGIVPALVAPAAAQRTVVHERTVVHRTEHRGWQSRKVCRVERHHGHRTRVCRSVRFR